MNDKMDWLFLFLPQERVRAVTSANVLEITDTNDYYPFGMSHLNTAPFVGAGNYKNYKYNGKELQETGMYDYGARMYMPDIGRWGTVDPLAETTMDPYGYVWNNPIIFNDPNGMSGTSTHTDKSGNVIAVFDDGDLGVYKHSGNAQETKKEIDQKYNNDNTSAGGEKMGRTLTKYSFTRDGYFDNKGVGNPVGKIDFKDDWNDAEIQ